MPEAAGHPDPFVPLEFVAGNDKVAIGVGYLPVRASLCVYVHRPGVIEDATAYFRGTPNEQRRRARKFIAALRELLELNHGTFKESSSE